MFVSSTTTISKDYHATSGATCVAQGITLKYLNKGYWYWTFILYFCWRFFTTIASTHILTIVVKEPIPR
jgi:hypothetical protein